MIQDPTQHLQYLQENFSLPGVLAFEQNEAGLIFARIATSTCSGELYLQGAHVTRWQPRSEEVSSGPAESPVLYLSPHATFVPGKAIRGGVPVIFPWFGDRRLSAAGAPRTDGPAHGFARTQVWTLAFAALSDDELHLTLTLAPSEQSRQLGYDHFSVAYQVTFGETLSLRMTVANNGETPLHVEEALHTYFSVDDAATVRVLGLNDTEYLDKTDGMKRKRQNDAVLTLTGETDRPYLNTSATVMLEDAGKQRHVFVNKAGSKTTVVWNPGEELSAKLTDLGSGEWRHMMCVETANALENTLVLPPKTAHTMQAELAVEPL